MSDHADMLRQKLKDSIRPRFVYAKFPIKKTEAGIEVCSTILVLEGNDIRRLLENAEECIIMAATLGMDIDRLISYTQRISLADAVVLDEAASNEIEDVCDNIQSGLAREYCLTRRYSCGYGDLPLSIQPKILSVLDTQKAIGLFCDKNSIMSPRKSVTAIWGIIKGRFISSTQDMDGCESCLIKQNCKNGCRYERRD